MDELVKEMVYTITNATIPDPIEAPELPDPIEVPKLPDDITSDVVVMVVIGFVCAIFIELLTKGKLYTRAKKQVLFLLFLYGLLFPVVSLTRYYRGYMTEEQRNYAEIGCIVFIVFVALWKFYVYWTIDREDAQETEPLMWGAYGPRRYGSHDITSWFGGRDKPPVLDGIV